MLSLNPAGNLPTYLPTSYNVSICWRHKDMRHLNTKKPDWSESRLSRCPSIHLRAQRICPVQSFGTLMRILSTLVRRGGRCRILVKDLHSHHAHTLDSAKVRFTMMYNEELRILLVLVATYFNMATQNLLHSDHSQNPSTCHVYQHLGCEFWSSQYQKKTGRSTLG